MKIEEVEVIEALAMKACAGSRAVSLSPGKLLALCYLAKLGAWTVEKNDDAVLGDAD